MSIGHIPVKPTRITSRVSCTTRSIPKKIWPRHWTICHRLLAETRGHSAAANSTFVSWRTPTAPCGSVLMPEVSCCMDTDNKRPSLASNRQFEVRLSSPSPLYSSPLPTLPTCAFEVLVTLMMVWPLCSSIAVTVCSLVKLPAAQAQPSSERVSRVVVSRLSRIVTV